MPASTVSIDGIYNGAVNCGNGGYICGLLAGFIDGDAEVRINSAFPVETSLEVVNTADGGVEMYLDDKCLGSARPAMLALDIPTPPDFETARRASEDFVFLHNVDVKGCFVCSPLRTPDKGLRLFIGALEDIRQKTTNENLVAALWRPAPNQADAAGNIKDVYVWSVLDCPGVYALKLSKPESGVLVLGSCTGSIKQPLPVNQSYVVSCWRIAPALVGKELANVQGKPGGKVDRKLHMGVAIHSLDGQLMACARQVCFDVGSSLPRPHTSQLKG